MKLIMVFEMLFWKEPTPVKKKIICSMHKQKKCVCIKSLRQLNLSSVVVKYVFFADVEETTAES